MMRRWLRRLAPWVIAGGAITAIVLRYPPAEIAAEMEKGDLLAAAPWAAMLVGLGLFLVALSDRIILLGAVGERAPGYLDLVKARAGLSLLGLIGYAAGVGGLGVWIARTTRSGAKLAAGAALYMMSADLVAVATVASLSIWLGGAEVGALRVVAPALVVVFLGLKLLGPFGLIGRERLPVVFHPWSLISRRAALAAVLLRSLNIGFIVFGVWGGANAFGVPVPLTAMLTYFPIVLVVGSMPVNVGGFGAVQGAWLLLEPWATSGSQLLAFSVLWHLVVGVAVLLRGLPFVRGVVRQIDSGASSASTVTPASADDASA